MDFSSMLVTCGDFGRFQTVLLLLYGYTNILGSLHYFSQTLITFTPEHWCYHEDLKDLSPSDVKAVYANVSHKSCTLLEGVVNGTGIVAHSGKCHDWIFNREQGYESVTTELKWVCDKAYNAALGQTFFFVGSVAGTILFGYLSDCLGRLPTLVLTTLIGGAGDFFTSFISSFPLFAVSRFVAGLSTDTMYFLMYILVFEYLSPRHRTFGLNIILAVFYCFGLMISPWLAIWVGNWRHYLWIASLPAIGVLAYPLLLCESAQWLLTKKKYDQAVKSMRWVAKFNGRHVDESVFEEFARYHRNKDREEQNLNAHEDTFMGMFRTPYLRRCTVALLLKSIIITLSYDVINRNMEGLGTSPFLLFSYTSINYLPAGCTILFLQNIVGRRGMACGALLIGGIITTVTGFLIAFLDPQENALLLAVMVGLGRYGVTVSSDAEIQYAAEIIPTTVRGQAISNIHVVGLASNSLVFYVIYLAQFYKPLPSIFISCLMFFGALVCLTLPETQNKKLPENLAEAEAFVKQESQNLWLLKRKKSAASRS